MTSRKLEITCILLLVFCVVALPAAAQSFHVQCPPSTITHPSTGTNCSTNPTNPGCNNTEPPYNGPTQFTRPTTGTQQWVVPTPGTVNGAIKCQNVSGGDGLMTEADGTQTFMFSFGPLSGLADIASGRPGTQFPYVFNTPYSAVSSAPLVRGDPAYTDGAVTGSVPWTGGPTSPFAPAFTWNGAVGITPDVVQTVNVSDITEGAIAAPGTAPDCPTPGLNTVTAYTYEPIGVPVGSQVIIATSSNSTTPIPAGFEGTFAITCVDSSVISPGGFAQYAFQYTASAAGLAAQTSLDGITASTPPQIDGHVDPRQIIDVGVMNGNIPGPMVAFDEDDEMFLGLTNVGMIMRPDLFEQHTFHFHGYPNASSFYDGVPDATWAVNIGATVTYYYMAPDAGTYFYHCHITPPEHLQMGMVNQLYVRPRQDRVPQGGNLYTFLGYQNGIGLPTGTAADPRTVCTPGADILCSATMPAINTGATRAATGSLCGNPTATTSGLTPNYTYNDGDGSTCYDVEYPIQMHGFDPNFHFVGMTFNPELFVDMKDKYFLLNGRSYPDTVGLCGGVVTGCAPGPQATMTTDGQMHYSQPLPAIINIPAGGRALLRMVNLSVTEYHTLQSLGIPMKEVGFMAKLLRDQAGLNTEFYTNSITLGGGESLDVILDASDEGCGSVGCAAKLYPAGSVFYLYTPQLDHLSNDAENFGGMMTEVHICNSVTPSAEAGVTTSTFGNTCN